jgi:hypothetical protein
MQTKHLCLRLRADPTHGGMIDGAAVELSLPQRDSSPMNVITVDHRLARRVAAYEARDYIELQGYAG